METQIKVWVTFYEDISLIGKGANKMAELNDLNTSNSQFQEQLNQLRELLTKQLHDLHGLVDIADGIQNKQPLSKDAKSLKAYDEQIRHVKNQQQERFEVIDLLISKHVLAVKNGKASDENILVLGKEVRKTEAGIRTVKLFLCDVVNMLNPQLSLADRIDDRILYVFNRSTELKNEIALLQARFE